MTDDGGVESKTVPGMAEAIEDRRDELQLTPGQFADRVGVSRPIAAEIRKGARRGYNASTVYGVANALQWPTDWYKRLLDGDTPDESWHTPPRPSSHITERDYNSDIAELPPDAQAIIDSIIDREIKKQQS